MRRASEDRMRRPIEDRDVESPERVRELFALGRITRREMERRLCRFEGKAQPCR